MDIKRLNDNQIRCTLTREDLASRELKISELAYGTEKAKNLFRDMMGNEETSEEEYVKEFKNAFKAQPGVRANYLLQIEGRKMPLAIQVNGPEMECSYKELPSADVQMQISSNILTDIVHSRMTFQRAFMTGGIVSKGDFKILRMLDQIFVFPEK